MYPSHTKLIFLKIPSTYEKMQCYWNGPDKHEHEQTNTWIMLRPMQKLTKFFEFLRVRVGDDAERYLK